MKLLCKDGYFRIFEYVPNMFNGYYLVYHCIHCNRNVMTVARTAGQGFVRTKLKNKNHTCKQGKKGVKEKEG